MFCVDREPFSEIMETITPFMKMKSSEKAHNSSGAPVLLKMCLAVTLCWLAGASCLDLCFTFGITNSTFYHADGMLWPTMAALDAAYSIGFPFHDIDKYHRASTTILEVYWMDVSWQ